jgi:signal peptidase I
MNTEEMQPAINPGDYVLLNTSEKKFTYGDIIVYEHVGKEEWENFTSIFRVVGVSGDSIGIKDGRTIFNGQQNNRLLRKDAEKEIIEETLPNGQKITIYYYNSNQNLDMDMIKIPKDCYFILGDTRTGIMDSRYYGPVAKDKILGKVVEIKKK